jgi:hypothetical protein
MDYENLKRATPVCFHCSQSKKARALKNKYDIFEEILGTIRDTQ